MVIGLNCMHFTAPSSISKTLVSATSSRNLLMADTSREAPTATDAIVLSIPNAEFQGEEEGVAGKEGGFRLAMDGM